MFYFNAATTTCVANTTAFTDQSIPVTTQPNQNSKSDFSLSLPYPPPPPLPPSTSHVFSKFRLTTWKGAKIPGQLSTPSPAPAVLTKAQPTAVEKSTAQKSTPYQSPTTVSTVRQTSAPSLTSWLTTTAIPPVKRVDSISSLTRTFKTSPALSTSSLTSNALTTLTTAASSTTITSSTLPSTAVYADSTTAASSTTAATSTATSTTTSTASTTHVHTDITTAASGFTNTFPTTLTTKLPTPTGSTATGSTMPKKSFTRSHSSSRPTFLKQNLTTLPRAATFDNATIKAVVSHEDIPVSAGETNGNQGY